MALGAMSRSLAAARRKCFKDLILDTPIIVAILRPPPRGFAGGRSQVPLSEFGKVETVHAVEANSVDVLFPGKKFDLILCDIEGAEIDALKGMPETL